MTAVFTVKEGSQDRRAKKNPEKQNSESSLPVVASPLSLWSAMKLCLDIAVFFFTLLDCNLHRSLWSSCMDVPVPETEPWSGGWGRGGRGASCGLHFLWRENPARLSQEWNLKALSHCCFLFVHQVLLAEGNTVSVFLNPHFSGIYPRICWGFIYLTLLVLWIIAPDLRMHFGSAYFFTAGHPVFLVVAALSFCWY